MQTRMNRRSLLRNALAIGSAALVGTSLAGKTLFANSANEQIGIGIIGAGGRGNELAGTFNKAAGCIIVVVADPDSDRANKLAGKYGASAETDLRKVLENPAVDAVVIATCNHWHCLAAVMAMDAGKDVYVEKPLSHTQWEGEQVVRWSRKTNRIVQLGTQQRSDPLQSQMKAFLHQEKSLGEILYVQASRLGVRGSIGRRTEPLVIPPKVDYNLWLGPAEDQPLLRNQLHYDWHWDWNTGSGEMGNWGVHVLDDVRNVAYQDRVSTPTRIAAMGARLAWDDAGNSPNVHYAIFETELFPTVIALSNLPTEPSGKKDWSSRAGRPIASPGSGYVVACEGGYLLGQRGRGKAVDLDGKMIRDFRGGDMMMNHITNFLDAVRSRRREDLNAEIETGHYSTGWCNLANLGYRVATASGETGQEWTGIEAPAVWAPLMEELGKSLQPFGFSREDLLVSPLLTHDPKTERFTGDNAELANGFLKREYRQGFEIQALA